MVSNCCCSFVRIRIGRQNRRSMRIHEKHNFFFLILFEFVFVFVVIPFNSSGEGEEEGGGEAGCSSGVWCQRSSSDRYSIDWYSCRITELMRTYRRWRCSRRFIDGNHYKKWVHPGHILILSRSQSQYRFSISQMSISLDSIHRCHSKRSVSFSTFCRRSFLYSFLSHST